MYIVYLPDFMQLCRSNLADATVKKYTRFKGNNYAGYRPREKSRCVIHIFLLLVQELFNSKNERNSTVFIRFSVCILYIFIFEMDNSIYCHTNMLTFYNNVDNICNNIDSIRV